MDDFTAFQWIRIYLVPVALLLAALAPRKKAATDWLMVSGAILLLFFPLHMSFMAAGSLLFAFGFFIDSLGRRQRARAEAIHRAVTAAGEDRPEDSVGPER